MPRLPTVPRTGCLLVATHDLVDPNFDGAVVLLLDHDGDGTVGVVLNRPGPARISDLLPRWESLANAPKVVFQGGPVGPQTVVALGVGAVVVSASSWEPVAPQVGVVDLDAAPPGAVTGIRVFAGYAGWAPGQLEAEIADGSWWVVTAEPADVTTPDPERLWRAVLVRQGGLFTTVPDDPTAN